MNTPTILVIGSANADLITRVARCPQPGESLIGSSFVTLPGGKGANQAVAAARLGARTHFAGCVGRDALGDLLASSLTDAGVDVSALRRHATEPTGTALIVVAEDGQNFIVVTPAANFGVAAEDIAALEPVMRGADAVLVQLEIPREAVAAALRLARACGVPAILDAGPAQPVADELLALAAVVSPNETEAQAITGVRVADVDSAGRAASLLLERGANEVVLKLGALGAYYAGPKGARQAPAFSVNPVDTVAAGDAFTAALALQWKSAALDDALRFANAAGALATLTPGAQPAMPDRAAVERFLHERNAG